MKSNLLQYLINKFALAKTVGNPEDEKWAY